MTDTKQANTAGRGRRYTRFAPAVLLAAGLGLFFAFGLHEYFGFEALRDNRQALSAFAADNRLAAALIFMAVYALATALSLPGGLVLTVSGGFLFGTWVGTGYVVLSATIGAVAVFLAARDAFADLLRAKAGRALGKMQGGLEENALSYLLVLRLVPLFPFFVVNIVPALVGVRLRTYILGTFFGIIPGAFVYASIGAGLGSVFDAGDNFTLAGTLTPEVIAALIGLSALSLLPVVYRRMLKKRSSREAA